MAKKGTVLDALEELTGLTGWRHSTLVHQYFLNKEMQDPAFIKLRQILSQHKLMYDLQTHASTIHDEGDEDHYPYATLCIRDDVARQLILKEYEAHCSPELVEKLSHYTGVHWTVTHNRFGMPELVREEPSSSDAAPQPVPSTVISQPQQEWLALNLPQQVRDTSQNMELQQAASKAGSYDGHSKRLSIIAAEHFVTQVERQGCLELGLTPPQLHVPRLGS